MYSLCSLIFCGLPCEKTCGRSARPRSFLTSKPKPQIIPKKQLSHFKHLKNYIFLHDLINLFMPSSMIVLDFQIFIIFFSDCARIKKYIIYYQDQFFIEKTFNRNQDISRKHFFKQEKERNNQRAVSWSVMKPIELVIY